MDMELDLRQKQELRLTPMLLQAMEILQMNVTDLRAFLSEELQENPVLEGELGSGETDLDAQELARRLDWINGQSVRRAAPLDDDSVVSAAELLAAPSWEETLEAHLLMQLDSLELTPQERLCARYLVRCVDGRGYLTEPPESFAARFSLSGEQAGQLLEKLRTLDPPGICAAGLRECLLAQLRGKPDAELAAAIVEKHLEDVAARRLGAVARALGVSAKRVERAVALIRALDPTPGAGFPAETAPQYIIPDILVERAADGFSVSLNDGFLPELSISSYYAALQRENAGGEAQEYLTERLQRARWIINGVRQRQDTLLRCAKTIVALQDGYFRGAEASLRPMAMNDVAAAIGTHPSTVSRAVKDKFLQCDRGVFPLRALFVRGVSGEDGASADLARNRIAALVAAEESSSPLSDQKLCEALQREGVEISRRTVAKYREELRIPGSSQRRR